MNKIIFDPLYGTVELTPKCLQIIDTTEFQRLRNIKQLGSCYYIFPGASHNRFEHSIGVCFLAKELLSVLIRKQPELDFDNEIKECIPIAGLCHDLGHGPFSHCFDNDFLVKYLDTNNPVFHHENRSILILKFIIEKYKININKKQLYIISELIYPKNMDLEPKFIYNIVSNPINGIDVDKFDYIKRDTYNIGLSYGFDYQRIFNYAKVINQNICFPFKMVYEIRSLFEIRHRLHKEIYTHPVSKSIDLMIADILDLANNEYKIVENIENINEFCSLNDNILYLIEKSDSESENILKAKEIIKKINTRDLYKFIGKINIDEKDKNTYTKSVILDVLNIQNISDELRNNMCLVLIDLSYNFNPLDNINLYKKKNGKIQIVKQIHEKSIFAKISDIQIRFYSKDKKYSPKIKEIFNQFCEYYYK
jgi:deoxynucleoside triphosphate triphosphohydrolase SAMHD1